MERADYPAMLAAVAPSHAVDILNERVAHVGRLNNEIADWLAERRRLEEVYANGLRKLARRQIQGIDLGIFSVPWNTLSNATETQADSHASLATKIETDVERPLRDFTRSSRELQAITTTQGNIGVLAKDVDAAQARVDKAQAKGDSNKLASANQEIESAQGQWDSQAPYVFENLQTLDEARFNHLRDVLTQLHTHEVDQVEKDRVSAEQCLNVLLNIEVADEIKTFVLKAVSSRPRVERSARQTTSSTPSSTRPNLAPTLSQASGNEESSQRTGSIQEEKKGPLKGLKRFSTVMGRKKDRSSKLPSQLESMAESPETKQRSFGFGRKKKDTNTLEAPQEESTQRPYSPLRVGSEAFEPAELRQQGAPVHSAAVEPSQPSTVQNHAVVESLPNGSHQNDLADLHPPAPIRTDSLPKRDLEGFSQPPSSMDPITRAQQEAAALGGDGMAPQYNVNIRDTPIADNVDTDAALASMASKLQMQAPPPQRRLGTVRGRREARNSAFITNDQPGLDQSISNDASPSLSTTNTSSFPTSQANNTTFVPALASTIPFNPSASTSSAFSTLPAATEATSPFKPVTRALTGDAGDNHSIRSGRSLASTTSQGQKHPELSEQGLNVSIVENINARFESGKLLSSSLVGEIALAYNVQDSFTPLGSETIRLDNFSQLEKVAPNPAFVNTAGQEGLYTINLPGVQKTQVAFKYQARLSDAQRVPLLITTAFKIEPTQTSVIVSYALNPSFSAESVSLTNVMLALTLEGSKATGCQSKPVGTFSREKNLIFWQIGDLTLTRAAAPVKLLARFTTESEAKSGNVEARWELIGEQAMSSGSGLTVSTQAVPGSATDSDPFADESTNGPHFRPAHTIRKLASGNYSAK